MQWINWTAETWNAVGAGLAALLVGLGGVLAARGKSKPASKPSVHQEMVRPQTAAEARTADATEKLADAAEKIERHIDLLTRTRN